MDNVFKQIRIRNTSEGWLAVSILVIPLVTMAGTIMNSAVDNEMDLW